MATASDPLTGGPGGLGANWTANNGAGLVGTLRLLSNACVPDAASDAAMSFWSGAGNPFGTTVYSKGILGTIETGGTEGDFVYGMAFSACQSNTVNTHYFVRYHTVHGVQLMRVSGDSYSQLDIDNTLVPASADTGEIRCMGSGVVSGFLNGVEVVSVTDGSPLADTGRVGMFGTLHTATPQVLSWEGGDYSSAPIPNIGQEMGMVPMNLRAG